MTPHLVEWEERSVKNGPENSPAHILIEGDNLAALKELERNNAGAIDIIYIDPPYNTLKHNFSYNDSMVDRSDSYIHSKWISFMSDRLKIAKKLLGSKGVIFISIDNSELYNLKLLCDQIFGEQNFIANMIWKTITGNNVRQITTEHEYILCYAKCASNLDKWVGKPHAVDLFLDEYKILKDQYETPEEIQKALRVWIKENKEVLGSYSNYKNVDEKGIYSLGDASNPHNGGYSYAILHPKTGKPVRVPEKGYAFSEALMKELIAANEMQFGKDETGLIRKKNRIENCKSLLRGIYNETSTNAAKSLEKIFHEKNIFTHPKTVNLLKTLFSFAGEKDAVILDFFAGSGTTGQAVLELNAEDGGNRQFILCTNNEISPRNTMRYIHDCGYMLDYQPEERTSKKRIFKEIEKCLSSDLQTELFIDRINSYDEYGICRFVTYPRLKAVITGVCPDGSKYSDGLPANMNYYRITYFPKGE